MFSLHLKAIFIGAPLTWGTYFLSACLYTSALTFTSLLVQYEDPHIAWGNRKEQGCGARRIAIFAAKLIGLYVSTVIIFFLPLLWILQRLDRAILQSVWLPYAASFLASAGIAWLLTPTAIALLRKSNALPIRIEARRWGIYSALLAITACSALSAFCNSAVHAHPSKNGTGANLIYTVIAILTALPYIPLYIALALLADETAAQYNQP